MGRRARRTAPLIIALIMTLLPLGLASGCRRSGTAANGRAITVAGSTSVQPFAEILAEDYFKEKGYAVDVQGGGSSAGSRAALDGVADIGSLSRELKKEEASLTGHVIALDAIAIVVHPTNQLSGLSLAQIKDIFTGRITDWSQLGGTPGRITVISREEGSGTRGAFDELVMGKNELTQRALVQDSNGSVKETVAQDERAIGYISLGIVDARVRAVAVDGVPASLATAASKQYRLVRPFIFATKGEPIGHVKEFIDYVLGPTGQRILSEEGLVPVGPTQ
jgi:phosphate transport system substrate-binding protein